MSEKTTEQAAEEYANELYPNTAAYNAIAYRSFINGRATVFSTITTLQTENDRLRAALSEIEQMSDSGSFISCIIDMKRSATAALNAAPPINQEK